MGPTTLASVSGGMKESGPESPGGGVVWVTSQKNKEGKAPKKRRGRAGLTRRP